MRGPQHFEEGRGSSELKISRDPIGKTGCVGYYNNMADFKKSLLTTEALQQKMTEAVNAAVAASVKIAIEKNDGDSRFDITASRGDKSVEHSIPFSALERMDSPEHIVKAANDIASQL